MKDRKKLVPHFIAVIAICLFGFLALGSLPSKDKTVVPTVVDAVEEDSVISSVTTSSGVLYHVPPPGVKPYTTLGLVFASSATKYDEKGNTIASQEGIMIMLLREAKALNADDIFNVRISENVTWTANTTTEPGTSSGSSTKTTTVMTKTVTYTGSALAVKYVN
jgi:hypothetical protein